METDKTTLADLSIFSAEEENSVFNKLNYTRTGMGSDQLRANFSTPLSSIEEITGIQQTLRIIGKGQQFWPMQISNGTIMVVRKFYDTTIDEIPEQPTAFSSFTYKLFHGPDFSLVKYSAGHCFDFIKGTQEIVTRFFADDCPVPLKKLLVQAKELLAKEPFRIVEKNTSAKSITVPELLRLARYLRYNYKQQMMQLLAIYAQLDAWYGMTRAMESLGLVFPEFIPGDQPVIASSGLYHILLEKPVSYDITLNPESNFLFLTGANMAGKSTFIKSVGTAVFLAHTGFGVPARSMQLSLFDGLLSNINVVDNIVKGESYFFNEVQRIKATITRINNGKKWLILIDELFKGTNVQDAMKCSSAVIEGMLKIRNSLFILSTHLYEIGEELTKYPNISFKYFETSVTGDQLQFSYQLKEGISNDRLGYLILKKEGVVDLLESL